LTEQRPSHLPEVASALPSAPSAGSQPEGVVGELAVAALVEQVLASLRPSLTAVLMQALGQGLAAEPGGQPAVADTPIHAVLGRIFREIAAVRTEFRDLRRVKERLEQMQGEKLFAFTDQIDPESFRILCGILAHGDVAKASRALNLKDATLRSRMADWEQRGPAYRVLVDLVRWRKAMGRKGTVALNQAITHGTAAPCDFAGLLTDVLDEVLGMNAENWPEKADALAELLRPHVPR
jgi:hypothetical protein